MLVLEVLRPLDGISTLDTDTFEIAFTLWLAALFDVPKLSSEMLYNKDIRDFGDALDKEVAKPPFGTILHSVKPPAIVHDLTSSFTSRMETINSLLSFLSVFCNAR